MGLTLRTELTRWGALESGCPSEVSQLESRGLGLCTLARFNQFVEKELPLVKGNSWDGLGCEPGNTTSLCGTPALVLKGDLGSRQWVSASTTVSSERYPHLCAKDKLCPV